MACALDCRCHAGAWLVRRSAAEALQLGGPSGLGLGPLAARANHLKRLRGPALPEAQRSPGSPAAKRAALGPGGLPAAVTPVAEAQQAPQQQPELQPTAAAAASNQQLADDGERQQLLPTELGRCEGPDLAQAPGSSPLRQPAAGSKRRRLSAGDAAPAKRARQPPARSDTCLTEPAYQQSAAVQPWCSGMQHPCCSAVRANCL